ncbi:MAG: S1 RNA-binding domain-containing protein [Clostridiales bacterium]|nr:S1 RNA-binding domain-containing protein [Clostridiales bacterium]
MHMIELGKYNTLEAIKKTDFGLYLGEANTDGNTRILLPQKEVPEGINIGDKLEVFVYKDSEDRDIATTSKVPLTVGELAILKVKEVNQIGAFLDWGLAKDLLLPFKEQTTKVKEGDYVLVSLYIDKSKRLCATMKVYNLLSTNPPYKKDDMVEGIVYDYIDSFGFFIAVDGKYSALIPKNQIFQPIKIGDKINARITEVREDGKLTLSLREKSYIQLDADALMIMSKLTEAGGFLPYHDKSDPESIKSKFNISKNAFKRAIGRLYKAGDIIITDDGIKSNKNTN